MMRLIKKSILIISIAVIGLNYVSANPKNSADTCEILLIGSSYFNYNNLKDLIKNLADSSGIELYIEMHGQNGLYLSDHASSPGTEAKINERDWDYVILQGVGILVAYPDSFPDDHPVYPALVTLRDKIHANCESTKMVFQMPWAFEDGMIWYQGWTDTFEDMQIHVYNNTLQYSDEIGFEIAPVGWVWYAVLEEYDYPLHYLHMSDWNHPSLKGSYLMACTIFSAVFQESTVGNPYHAGIPDEEADYFQAVASDTVLNNLDLWNITPLVSVSTTKEEPDKFNLYQNNPNPVKGNTKISYYIPKELWVSISIFNALGKKMTILIDQTQRPGYYEIKLDATKYINGIYYYKMIYGNYIQTKKMIVNR